MLSKHSPDIEDLLSLQPCHSNNARMVPTSSTKQSRNYWTRFPTLPATHKHYDFRDVKKTTMSEQAALAEATRCLKCVDAPCQKSCPTQIDIKYFIGCISNGNYYGAAKAILTDNPVGLTCGMVCPTSDLCVAGCNLAASEAGPINISGLQHFAMEAFAKMNLKQIRDPSVNWNELDDGYKKKIALIGAGPASICCATFLARMGYSDITIFEKEEFPGGLSSQEIPAYRLPYAAVDMEMRLMMDLGVKVKTGQALGHDFTLQSLKDDGFSSIFVGVGLGAPKQASVFDHVGMKEGYYTSKDFLPLVSKASKPGMCGNCSCSLPKLYGTVVVLGAGDTAFDCASSALRCGAKKVFVAFRRGFNQVRAVREELDLARDERCEFLPFVSPTEVIQENGRIKKILFCRNEEDDDGVFKTDADQVLSLRADFVISAFGAGLEDGIKNALRPLKFKNETPLFNPVTMQTSESGVFVGGDITGSSHMTVEAANDGKQAAWYMHTYLHPEFENSSPKLPGFYSEIDAIDLGIDICGIHFKNPFGLASAPPTTSAPMIRRAFEAGWGYAVTKTFVLDKDAIKNITPRIIKNGKTYLNIEIVSEKPTQYWLTSIAELKKDFPDHVLIASIMCGYNEEDWKLLSKLAEDSGADALELNLSCPHGMGEKGMGLACGQQANLVHDICSWVKASVSIPFFAKLTPNVTDVLEIAKAAKSGGAWGVTAINTVSGMMRLNGKGIPDPAVGSDTKTTFGGLSGGGVRPLALRAVARIGQSLPDFPILATGGADSAETVLQFIYCGASAVQISSAIQDQDFSIVQDYLSGLKTLMYMKMRPGYENWNGQHPPIEPHQKGKLVKKSSSSESLPNFGSYMIQKHTARKNKDILLPYFPKPMKAAPKNWPIPTLPELVGFSLRFVSTFNGFSRDRTLIAEINEDMCINCGKCYMTCNDTGYQAIEFDGDLHLPKVLKDRCSGCNLCVAVCPVMNCITMTVK